MAEININIAGDFIDSFIYSGVLFTVDTNGVLCSYSWRNLVDNYFRKYPAHSHYHRKVLDCREEDHSIIKKDITIVFEKEFLEKNQKGTCCDLDVWTTDLDVKDNILYISSERGLVSLPFLEEWDNGKIMKFNQLIPLWKEAKVFGLSTGSWGRTILAAGDNGALEIMNNGVEQLQKIGFHKKKEKVIDSNICLDCEWSSNSTLAILDGLNSKAMYMFDSIESDSRFKESNKSNKRNQKKITEDDIKKIAIILKNEKAKNISKNEIQHSWFEDGRLYAVDSNNKRFYFKGDSWVEVQGWELNDSDAVVKLKNITAGNFIETDSDELYRVANGKKEFLSNDFTSWRVFPRSKNYQDRIHVVKDEYLQIKIFNV
ncbi:hypothetical protein [Pantoea ananatis]|uniref:hypothetical protein n=1 Tax=Pantoea ananas TaxID=553 RepID=UPI001B30F5E2|nr:hypothetical protein [Pantoea ananatis]